MVCFMSCFLIERVQEPQFTMEISTDGGTEEEQVPGSLQYQSPFNNKR